MSQSGTTGGATGTKPQASEGTVAAALIRSLAERGVTQLFGIPGVHNTELFRDLERFGIDVVLPRHEQGAGFMADGYARASGRPAVCLVITGPGVTNALTPFGQAYSDSVPLLLVSTVLGRRDLGKGRGLSHDMADQAAAVTSFGALSLTVEDAGEVPELVRRAFATFACQRPRPVHLQIPLDRLRAPAERPAKPARLAARPVPPEAALSEAARLIGGARRPVIVAGGGAVDAAAAVRALVERSGAALGTTIAGKGVLAERHPLSLGCTLARPATRAFLGGCDLAVVVGSELSQNDVGPQGLPEIPTLIRIDIDPQALATNAAADLPLLGDAGAALEALVALLPVGGPHFRRGEIEEVRAHSQRQAYEERPGMEALLRRLRRCLPRETVFALDMTEIAYLANEVFEVDRPRCWLHPVGFGTLGYALPAAIGAKLARPELPVAGMIGDFGLQYTLPELGVACERRLPIPIFLWNNERLRAIEKDMVKKQIEPVAVRAQNPDFLQLARSFGAAAACPGSLNELEAAVARALDDPRPTLIELRPEACAG